MAGVGLVAAAGADGAAADAAAAVGAVADVADGGGKSFVRLYCILTILLIKYSYYIKGAFCPYTYENIPSIFVCDAISIFLCVCNPRQNHIKFI